MTTVGLFAGRGDVVLAMGLALLVGLLLGWQLRGVTTRVKDWWNDRDQGTT